MTPAVQDTIAHELINRNVIGSVSYLWPSLSKPGEPHIEDIDNDVLDELVEELFTQGYIQEEISAAVACFLNLSESIVRTSFKELDDGTSTVFVFIKLDRKLFH